LSRSTNLLNFKTNLGSCKKNSYQRTSTIKLDDVRLAEIPSSNLVANYNQIPPPPKKKKKILNQSKEGFFFFFVETCLYLDFPLHHKRFQEFYYTPLQTYPENEVIPYFPSFMTVEKKKKLNCFFFWVKKGTTCWKIVNKILLARKSLMLTLPCNNSKNNTSIFGGNILFHRRGEKEDMHT